VPPQVPPMTIEFTAPAPPVVEPPPPEPLPPVVEEPPPPVVDENAVKPPPPKPVPKPKPKPKPQPRPKPAPLTPPSANAGYLHNPAPEYPALAMRRGWEGTVLLRVHVLASGSPSEIQVQKSSGREALDQAAVKAVKRWSFVPAKRGDKAEDGWVSVPIDFKLN
ncbi:energy transducer TonB, partial [Pseudomonas aeruginosa]